MTEHLFCFVLTSGEPIHKVATRGIKLWKEFDTTVFAMPREKRGAWLQERKDYIIKRLNADFQKPWVRTRPPFFRKGLRVRWVRI
jgi:enoyl reductase-like protein